MLLSLLAAAALAAPASPPDDDLDVEEEKELARLEAADAPKPKRGEVQRKGPIQRYELAFRGHAVSVPKGVMNVWFHHAKDDGWPLDTDRPGIMAGTYGLELSMLDDKNRIAKVYVEALQSFMGEGYWDDREDGEQFYNDGRWVRPSPFFGAVIIGANGAYDAVLVRPETTKGAFSMGFQVGGGLGLAVMVGDIQYWTLDPNTGSPAYVQKDVATSTKMDLRSPVWPVPDLNLGFRFTFGEVVTLKLEAGLHGGFSYGGTLGGRF